MENINKRLQAYAKIVGCLPLLKDFTEKLGFSDIIDRICPADQQAFLSFGTVAKILVLNRLSSPKPLYKIEEWSKKSGVEEVFGIQADYLNDDKLGRALEVLAENAHSLKGAISLDIARKFKVGLEHLHWDLQQCILRENMKLSKTSKISILKLLKLHMPKSIQNNSC